MSEMSSPLAPRIKIPTNESPALDIKEHQLHSRKVLLGFIDHLLPRDPLGVVLEYCDPQIVHTSE